MACSLERGELRIHLIQDPSCLMQDARIYTHWSSYSNHHCSTKKYAGEHSGHPKHACAGDSRTRRVRTEQSHRKSSGVESMRIVRPAAVAQDVGPLLCRVDEGRASHTNVVISASSVLHSRVMTASAAHAHGSRTTRPARVLRLHVEGGQRRRGLSAPRYELSLVAAVSDSALNLFQRRHTRNTFGRAS